MHEDSVVGDRSEVGAHALVDAGARLEPRTRLGRGERSHGTGAT